VFRAYPTRPQEGRAVKLLRDHCDLYNTALEERREAWRMRKAPVSYGMQSAQLRDIRGADPVGQGRHSFTAQQQTLRRLDEAFAAFFQRDRNADKNGDKKPGYARFKPYSRFRQVRFVNGDGAKWTPAERGGWARAYFQSVGSVKVRQHRQVPGTVKALQLKQEHRRWYVIVITETEPAALNKSILDAAWFQFTCILIGKAEEAARRVVLVNPAGTSITCHRCRARCARPRQDTVICPACGPMDADVNGAINIASRAGLGSGQAVPAA
jgi:transposase